jgi:hypothetical protein
MLGDDSMAQAVEFVERSGRPMIWVVRLLVVAAFMLWGASTGRSPILGFLAGWMAIGLSLLVGKVCNKICSKAPIGAKRAGLLFYWLGIAVAIYLLGIGAYAVYLGVGAYGVPENNPDRMGIIWIVVRTASLAVVYWSAGWGLHRALTTPSASSPPSDGQVTSGYALVKQRKIAISLAVVGAIAAPFVFDTYSEWPMAYGLVPLTGEEKVTIAAELKKTNNCQMYEYGFNEALRGVEDPNKKTEMLLNNDNFLRGSSCREGQRRLEAGGDFKEYPDTSKYLTINAAIVGSAFAVIYGLAFFLPALARRYWRWLNT